MSNINSTNIRHVITLVMILFNTSCTYNNNIPSFKSSEFAHKIIPLRTLFANSDEQHGYKISPNGKKLAWLDIVKGKAELFIKDLITNKQYMVNLPFISKNFYWADKERFLILPIYLEQFKKHGIGVIDTKHPNEPMSQLLPQLSGSLQLQQQIFSPEISLLLKHTTVDNTVEFINLSVVKKTWDKIEIGSVLLDDLIIDNKNVIARIRIVKNKRYIEKYNNEKHRFLTIATCDNNNAYIKLLSVDQDGFLNYMSNCETDTVQLIKAKSALDKTYFCDSTKSCQFDLEQVITHPLTGIPQFAVYHKSKAHIVNLTDVDYANATFFKNLQGTIFVTSIDRHFNFAVIDNSSYLGYGFDLLDLKSFTTTHLSEPQLSKYKSFLKEAEWVDLKLGNDEHLFGYYYPPQIHIKNKSHAVILLHGGPEERAYPDYDKEAILLSNRGYSVLSLNYRGSKGFGHTYKDKAIENIDVMLKDIDVATNWLETNKHIDKDSIGIMGSSYGGYLALLASKSSQYQCIVSINGIYDLYDTAVNFPGSSNNFFSRYYGSIKQIATGEYDDYSPIKYTEYNNTKYLLVQSKYDDIIPLQSAVNFYNLIKKRNEVTFTQLNDGHTINRWFNRLETYRDVEVFLHTCLGGIDGGFEYYLLAKPFYN
ncbi:MAG: dienelactone hydrolase [Alteromonadaceae bacterium]|jgi:dienelactone hydrolase